MVDDHPIITNGLTTFLEHQGHEIIAVCSNGIEAYNLILAKEPSIAIVDISIPGMNGIDILKKVQEQKLRTKIIIYTMQNELSIFNRALALGASGYILKELQKLA